MARFSGSRTPVTDAEREEIVHRYAAGEHLVALCAEFKRAKSTVRRMLADAGVPMRPMGNPVGTVWSPARRAAHHAATHTPEFREQSRQSLLKRLPGMRGPATNTAIEQRMHDALRAVGIGFTTQSCLLGRYLVDIELHQAQVVIEADGAQHQLRERRVKDAERDAELTAAGYRVFRFTGSQINRDAAECVKRIVEACGLVAEHEPVYDIRTRFAGAAHPNWKGGKREFTCAHCGTVFLSQPVERRHARTFCSSKCYGASMRGKPQDPEHLRKRIEGMARSRAAKTGDQIKI